MLDSAVFEKSRLWDEALPSQCLGNGPTCDLIWELSIISWSILLMEEIPNNHPGMYKTTSWYGKYPLIDKDFIHPRVVVWDFFHQPYQAPHHHLDMSLVPGSKSKFEPYIDFLWQRDWSWPNFLEWRFVETQSHQLGDPNVSICFQVTTFHTHSCIKHQSLSSFSGRFWFESRGLKWRLCSIFRWISWPQLGRIWRTIQYSGLKRREWKAWDTLQNVTWLMIDISKILWCWCLDIALHVYSS